MKNNVMDYGCLKTAGIVGTGIHLYTSLSNNQHISGIVEDVSRGIYGQAIAKILVPYALPYCVSLFAKRKAQNESRTKIAQLERTITELKGGQ